ncbi:MAG: endonuclease III domain-containing protein, partial [Candidatus Binatia bacterium]
MNAKQRVRSIVRALRRAYPGARTSLDHRNPFELVVATILSAQSTDVMFNKVTPVLFDRYPTPEALASADPSEVEAIVHPTGFFRQKTKSIIGCAQKIVNDFSSEVPRTVDELVTLPGVARKTANVVVANLWPHTGHG